MANEIKKVSSTEVELSLSIKWQDLEKKYDEELKKIQAKATLPGFRQGKAPATLVEKKLGDGFLQEVASDLMNDNLSEAISKLDEKDRPLPYSSTVLQDEEKVFPVKKGEDISYTVKYEVMPEFEVKNYKGLEIEYPNIKIGDDMVEKEITRLQEQNAIVKDKGDAPITKGDLVTVTYDAEGVKDSKRTDYTFTVGDHSSYYDFDDDIIGWKKGEHKTIEKMYKDTEKPIGFDGDKVTLNITIENVRSKELPKIDNEFAEDVNEEYKTVDDLKKGIRSRLEERLNDSLKETKLGLFIDKLLPEIKLEVPKCMVDFEVASTLRRFGSQMGMSEADTVKFLTANGQSVDSFTEPWRKDAEHTIASQLIINKIRDEEKIEASDEEVEAELKKEMPEGEKNKNYSYYKDIIKDNLAYGKAVDFVLKETKFIPSKKEIPYEDFASGAYLQQQDENDKENKKSEDK